MSKLKEINVMVSISLSSPDGDTFEKTQAVNVFVEDPSDDLEIAMEVEDIISELVSWDWERI